MASSSHFRYSYLTAAAEALQKKTGRPHFYGPVSESGVYGGRKRAARYGWALKMNGQETGAENEEEQKWHYWK